MLPLPLQFADCLTRELAAVKEGRAAFVEEFSEAEYNEVRAALRCAGLHAALRRPGPRMLAPVAARRRPATVQRAGSPSVRA